MKKLIASLVATSLFLAMGVVSVADESVIEKTPSQIIAIREDVSFEEAKQDITFDVEKSIAQESVVASDETDWNVWGEREDKVVDGVQGAIPLGYSEHKRGDTVLDTYHYTRTYLGLLKSGDSGRCWGTGTVCAKGTFCDDDVWWSNIHYVKYGTETR